jgi:phosphatidyl-myo-inositol dimannoside synthase
VRTRFHTFDRWLYNAGLLVDPPAADVVVGVDLDGFLWAGRRRGRPPRFVVALKGIIADELTHERGWVRTLLTIQARWECRNARRADHVVVPSAYSAGVAERLYGVPVSRISVIPEPIDLAAWRARLRAARRRGDDRPTVLAVARMYPRKHLHELLEATVLLRGRIPGLAVRIVGKGPEYPRLEALVRTRGLGGTVELLGDVSASRLAVEYVSAHCFCLPSVQEGFGIVFVEAMAAGLPVVGCRAAAVPEVVEHGRTGLLVAPDRADELAEAIAQLLLDGEMRKEMAVAGMERVEALDLDRVARQWLGVLGA